MGLAPSSVYALARSAGFTPAQAVTMTAIAGAESGWNPDAVGDTGLTDATWGPSVGLWQVRSLNAQNGTGQARDAARLKDPAFNARSARQVWSSQGFGAWSTFSNGRFRSYLGQSSSGAGIGAAVSGVAGAVAGAAGGGGAIVPGAKIGSMFGAHGSMWSHTGGSHTGIDLMAPRNTPIYARAGGTVERADYAPGSYGNHVRIRVDARTVMIYAHMVDTPKVRKGQRVTAGQLIGNVGQSGNARGYHCHFEVRIDGKPVDPAGYLTGGSSMSTVPTSWDASATPAGFDIPNPVAGAADEVWKQVKPALFTALFAAAGAGIVLVGLGITALPSNSQN